MKNLFLTIAIFSSLVVFGQSVTIKVENKASVKRDEVVQFYSWDLDKLNLNGQSFIIVDKKGKQVPYQILKSKIAENPHTGQIGKVILFKASVKSGGTSSYKVMAGIPEKFAVQSQITQASDSVLAWKNDRLSFVMKNAQGFACYKDTMKIGESKLTPLTDDSVLWCAGQYNAVKVIENGPLRSVFQLSWDNIMVDDTSVTSTLLVTTDAGSQFNKAFVSYEHVPVNMQTGAVITLGDSIGAIKTDKKQGFVSYSETAALTADTTTVYVRNHSGIIFKNGVTGTKQLGNQLLVTPKQFPTVYYFGGDSYNSTNSLDVASDKKWLKLLKNEVKKINNPLIVTIKQ